MNALSKRVYGKSSLWQKLMRKGYPVQINGETKKTKRKRLHIYRERITLKQVYKELLKLDKNLTEKEAKENGKNEGTSSTS